MPATGPSRSDLPSLYELYTALGRRRSTGDVHELVDAILLHRDFQSKLRVACDAILRHWRRPDDLRDDLLQEATCRLAALLVDGKRSYDDQGERRFHGWIGEIIRTETGRAWLKC